MRNTTSIKAFWKETYKTDSPIPFIISAQILVFLVVHFFKLLFDIELINSSIYDWVFLRMSIPVAVDQFITQPWSIITYPYLYSSIFSLLFDCLWLYFIGNSFLNLLNRRQFLTVYLGGMLLGGITYLSINQLSSLVNGTSSALYGGAMPLAALLVATGTLIPKSEVRLFLFGNVRLSVLISIYVGIQFIQLVFSDTVIGVSYFLVIFFGFMFMYSLKKGNDWSKIFVKTEKRKLKIVHHSTNNKASKKQSRSIDQAEIDGILDKISARGYESLSSHEKEILFRASKED